MTRRQTKVPRRWLVAHARFGSPLWPTLERLPRGTGVLIPGGTPDQPGSLRDRVLRTARRRGLVVVDESRGEAARVHNLAELRRARLAGVPFVFLSPMFETLTHPGRPPLPRMRAAAIARLAWAPVIALGGMDERRFRRIERLGFSGWAGIDAWLDTKRP